MEGRSSRTWHRRKRMVDVGHQTSQQAPVMNPNTALCSPVSKRALGMLLATNTSSAAMWRSVSTWLRAAMFVGTPSASSGTGCTASVDALASSDTSSDRRKSKTLRVTIGLSVPDSTLPLLLISHSATKTGSAGWLNSSRTLCVPMDRGEDNWRTASERPNRIDALKRIASTTDCLQEGPRDARRHTLLPILPSKLTGEQADAIAHLHLDQRKQPNPIPKLAPLGTI
eukprot:scaffold229162_cov35-Tisochrysis_lutea.AAC.4